MNAPTRPGQARRQEAIDAWCEAFARDEMELDEFERRVEAAHRTESSAELDRLLADLGPRPVPARRSGGSPAAAAPGDSRASARRATALPGQVRERELIAGVMGGSMRRGRWTPARRVTAIGVMGGVELDFRDAVLAPGVTEVHAFAFWGGVQILVPPDVRVECSGLGVMGGFDHRDDVANEPDASAPVLRITGIALMGGVEVRVRYPGESGKDARRRVREDRREDRLEDRRRRRLGKSSSEEES